MSRREEFQGLKNHTRIVRPGPHDLLSVFLVCALIGCGPKKDAGSNPGSNAGDLDAVPVAVAVAELKQLSLTKTYSGPLEGEEQANITAR
jgi:hypothetical protein